MGRITLLPHWVLTNVRPGFYDTDSGTTIEQTAKVYTAMRELQSDYNKFVDEVNKCITDFVSGINKDQECFEKKIVKLIHDYIIMLDSKIAHQDRVIEENVIYIKNNIGSEVIRVINEMKESGELAQIIGDTLEGLATSVNDLVSTTSKLEEDTENLISKVSSLEQTNINVEDRVSELEGTTNGFENRISTLESKNIEYNYDSENESITFILKGGN